MCSLHELDDFFDIIHSALWNEPLSISSCNSISPLFQLAQRQAVPALFARALIDNNVCLPSKEAAMMLSVCREVAFLNKRINERIKKLIELFHKENIKYVVVKGQSLLPIYTNPDVRLPGDIDLYVSEEDFDRCINLLKAEYRVERDYNEKHITFQVDDIQIEVHFRLLLLPTVRKQRYWDALVEKDINKNKTIEIEGTCIHTLTPTVNTAYLFIHIYHHFLKEGIGLKQLCDLALFIHKNKNEINWSRLNDLLFSLGYAKAFGAFCHLMIDILRLPQGDIPRSLRGRTDLYTRSILKIILSGGNFGQASRRRHYYGILRSIETGFISLKRMLLFFRLSPRIMLPLYFRMMQSSFRKNIF